MELVEGKAKAAEKEEMVEERAGMCMTTFLEDRTRDDFQQFEF